MIEVTSLLYACEFDSSGYAVAARRYLRALTAVGHPVAWQPLVNTFEGRLPTGDSTGAPAELCALPRSAGSPRTMLAHSMPMSWAALRDQVRPAHFIGQTVWEADRIPARWRQELATADEIWVPTEWNAATLRADGVEVPVRVVPHVVDSTVTTEPPIEVAPDTFMFVSTSTWDWRKRPDLTLHAYMRAFTVDDPVTLVLKTNQRVLSWPTNTSVERNTWWQVMEVVRQYPRAASVVLVTETWSDAEMAGLLRRADCYVSLTCVEGWGLGAFDAAAAGTPVVVTGYGGQMEWLGSNHPGAVPFRMVPADHPDRSMFEPGMTWALADVDAAAQLLRVVAAGGSECERAAPALAERIRRDYSEAGIGAQMVQLLS